MNRQENLRLFHNFVDFPVSWIQETKSTNLQNDTEGQWERKPKGDTENEKSQRSERYKRKLQLGMAQRKVREMGLPYRHTKG